MVKLEIWLEKNHPVVFNEWSSFVKEEQKRINTYNIILGKSMWDTYLERINNQIKLCEESNVVIPPDVLELKEGLEEEVKNHPDKKCDTAKFLYLMFKPYPNFQFFRSGNFNSIKMRN